MELNELLEQVDPLKAEIDALRPIDAAQERRIMQKFRLDWTFHSNAIEGNQLTYGETKAFLLHGITAQGKPFRDYLDIKGHHAAIDFLLVFVRQEEPITEADVRELHKVILVEPYQADARTPDGHPTKRTIQPGQYKPMPNHVETSTGEIHYYATPEETPAKMADLMAWYRRELDKSALHPLILAATFHYQFVVIHPFDDGNGRMARLLMNLLFMQAGYPPVIIRTEDKNSYLLALEQADTGDLEPFIVHIGNELLNSLNLFLRGAKGEDIEEIRDIDKKLALLEKRLEAQEEKVLFLKKKEEKLMSKLFEPFFLELTRQLTKFDKFFEDSSFSFVGGESRGRFTVEQIAILFAHISTVIGQAKQKQFEVNYTWSKLKASPSLNIRLVIGIVLEDTKFRIIYADSKGHSFDIIENVYGQVYSSKQINKLATNIANEIYKIIERQV